MFHRAGNSSAQATKEKAQKTEHNKRHGDSTERIGMEQTAVQRYALSKDKSQDEKQQNSGANQNKSAPYAVRKIDTNNQNYFHIFD